MLRKYLGQQLDQVFGAGVGQAQVAPLGFGQDEVDPGLGQSPQVRQLRLQLGASVTLGP